MEISAKTSAIPRIGDKRDNDANGNLTGTRDALNLSLNDDFRRLPARCSAHRTPERRSWEATSKCRRGNHPVPIDCQFSSVGLNWRDVDLQAVRLSVRYTVEELKGHRLKLPKTRAGLRNIELPAMAFEASHARRAMMTADGLAGCDLVLCDSKGGLIRRRHFAWRMWKPLPEAAEIPAIRFHAQRRTSAGLRLLQGERPRAIQPPLEHASISPPRNVYSHVLPGMKNEASASPRSWTGSSNRKRRD